MVGMVIGGAGIMSAIKANADANTLPGQAEDPIVTKSYVDAKVAELVKAELDKIGSVGGSSKLEVVSVPFGSKLVVEDGGELIVRTGKAVAYSADVNGLSDLTDGVDIKPGKPVGNNHLILNPRGARGVEADPKQTKGLIVLVRGAYSLQ